MRIEKDDLGELNLNDNTMYGTQTFRACQNFALNDAVTSKKLIDALLIVKKCCALANEKAGTLTSDKASFIIEACNQLLAGKYSEQFLTNPLQGGAGTSTNMNVNEVVANAALELAGFAPGTYSRIHPLNDVNMGQSTNDVYPTALRIACIYGVRSLSEEASRLQESLQRKELEYDAIRKLGRTELMDALPITLGQEFGAYAQAIARDRWRIYKVEERLRQINLGGTAVGTGSNANRKYSYYVYDELKRETGIGLARAEYPMDTTQNNDIFVEVSGLLKAMAVNLMKISNDLRLMNMGPYGGIGEIHLAKLQNGSTIMPGKVNPVIPEMVSQVAIRVMGHDQEIAIAAASGQFELNAFLPLIADALLDSLSLLTNAAKIMREKCIDLLEADIDNCQKHLDSSMVLITALTPYIGYDKAAQCYQRADGHKDQLISLLKSECSLSEEELKKILTYSEASTYKK